MKHVTLILILTLAVTASFLCPIVCCALDEIPFAQFEPTSTIPQEYPTFVKTSAAFSEYTSAKIIPSETYSPAIYSTPIVNPENTFKFVDQTVKTVDPVFTIAAPVAKGTVQSFKNSPYLEPIQPPAVYPYEIIKEEGPKVVEKVIGVAEPIVKTLVEIAKNNPPDEPISPIRRIDPEIFDPIIDLGKPIRDKLNSILVDPIVGFLEPIVKAVDERVKNFDPHELDPYLMTQNNNQQQTLPEQSNKPDMYWGEIIRIFTPKDQALETGMIPNDMFLTPSELRELDAKGLPQTGRSDYYTKDMRQTIAGGGFWPLPGEIVGPEPQKTGLPGMVENLIKILNPGKETAEPPNELYPNAEVFQKEPTTTGSLNIPDDPLYPPDWRSYIIEKTAIIPNNIYLTPQQQRELEQHGYSYGGASNNINNGIEYQIQRFENPLDPECLLAGRGGEINSTDPDGTVHYTIYDGLRHNHYYGTQDSIPKDIYWWVNTTPESPEQDKETEEKEEYNGNGAFQNGDGCDYSGMEGYGQEGFGEARSEGSSYDTFGNYVGPND
jgi:hypothetical protein